MRAVVLRAAAGMDVWSAGHNIDELPGADAARWATTTRSKDCSALRVVSDYQPIAAQVYERIQGLRREAYDSSDYLEGLNAFAEKRRPVFGGI